MKLQSHIILLCVAVLAFACLPALAQYQIECEDILAPAAGWNICLSATAAPGTPSNVTRLSASDPYAYGGSGLKIVDSLTGTDGNLFVRGLSSIPFSKQATVVVRLKTTDEQAFTATPWSRTVILSFLSDTTTKRAIGLSIRPDGTAVTNSTGNQFYPSGFKYACDNTHFVTYTMCGSFDGTNAAADVYRNGALIISTGATINSSPETQIHTGSPSNKGYDMVVLGSAPAACTGSYIIDRVAWKAGLDPAWLPWGAPTGTLGGVVSKMGDPSVKVADAKVTLSNGQSTQTDANGAYLFTGLDPEIYTVSVSAEGYFSKSVSASVTVTAPAATKNIEIVATPVSGAAVYDTFLTNQGDLSVTEDGQHLPWLAQADQTAYGVDYSCYTGVLAMNPSLTEVKNPHGFSIGGGFAPANLDMTVDVQMVAGTAGWGPGILYRQTQPCIYDNYPLEPNVTEYAVVSPVDANTFVCPKQDPATAGYLVWFTPDGKSAYLWRNGVVATVATSIDWTTAHKVRVIAFGNYHEVIVDGKRILSAIDNGKLTGGYVGVSRYETTTNITGIKVQPLEAGSTLGLISGSVYDAASPSTKLAGAYVVLSDGRTAVADSEGNYAFALAGFGDPLTVKAEFPGYVEKSLVVDPVAGTNALDFALSANAGYHASISGAKAAAVGSEVSISGKAITAFWSGTRIYVEEPNRSAGIKVVLPKPDANLYQKSGVCPHIYGTLRADAQTGERYIEATGYYEPPSAKSYVDPVAMNGRTILGKSGADVLGLDVKVVGKVTAVNSPTSFTINDGAGDLRIVVDPSVGLNPWPVVNDYIDAEGIVSLDGATPETAVRCVKLWNSNANHMDPIVAGFEKANPIEGWGWDDFTGGQCSLTWDTTNPHSGKNCAQFTNTRGFAPGQYGHLYTILGGQFVGGEYEVSCWVRGAGVVNTTQPAHVTDWSTLSYSLPGGDFGWQKVGTKFTFAGSNSGQYTQNLFIHCNVTEACTTLAVDDFYLRWARGSIHVLQPAP